MEAIFDTCTRRYIMAKGQDKYSTLYDKVKESDAFAKFCGLTVQKGVPPIPQDFITCVTSIWYVFSKFDQATNTMAALIALKLWNDKVNSKYHLVMDYQVNVIAERLASAW